MSRVGLIGLLKVELPEATVRICDGGFVVFDGETYRDTDGTFGAIASLQALTEGVGEEVPALELAKPVVEGWLIDTVRWNLSVDRLVRLGGVIVIEEANGLP